VGARALARRTSGELVGAAHEACIEERTHTAASTESARDERSEAQLADAAMDALLERECHAHLDVAATSRQLSPAHQAAVEEVERDGLLLLRG